MVRGVKSINHSQFTDDTLLLGGASVTIAKRFKDNLDLFTQASRGLINHLKSQIYAMECKSKCSCNYV
jgi:hypothetical protein